MKTIQIIPSKSYAHRAMICGALSDSPTRVICDLASDDIEATKACLKAMKAGEKVLECGESGSTLRFMVPVMGALGKEASFVTKGRLAQRPMGPLFSQLAAHGCKVSPEGETPITIEGQLTEGDFYLPGNVSSQFVTGLMLALVLLKGDSTIHIDGKLQSSAYVDITMDVLRTFGIHIDVYEDSFFIKGGQKLRGPSEYIVEGDWSAAAFWLVAGAIGKEPVKVTGLNMDSRQGDKRIVEVLSDFGVKFQVDEDGIISFPSRLCATTVDVSEIPDLTPAIALAAAQAQGTTEIINGGRLRLKESDRLTSIRETLVTLGCRVTETADGLIIKGTDGGYMNGGRVDSFGDHRIVMMAATASLVCEMDVEIDGKEAVNKSYPGFFKELSKWR